jgi:pilus assembly protein CpaC
MNEKYMGELMAIRSSTTGTVWVGRLAAIAVLIFLGLPGISAQQTPASASTTAQAQPPAVQAALSAAPPPSPAQDAQTPEVLHLLVGRSLVITSPTRIKRVSLADPAIAEALVVSPFQVVLNGKAPGGVSLVLWDESDQAETYEVSVDIDLVSLSQTLHEAFPGEPVQLQASRDVVMISGKISSQEVATKILDLVKNATPKVTSLMEVPVAPVGDILLEVKFADVELTSLSQLGINLLYPGTNTIGSVGTQQFSPPTLVTAGSNAGTTSAGVNGLTNTFNVNNLLNIFLYQKNINLAATIQALQQKNVLQILAEPNLLAASGKEASFLAGGEFPFPILQGTATGGNSGITIQFKEFGVRLTFTPTLEADGYIHLKVSPEVSSLDFTNALTISGFTIPALSTERFASEMDLKDGQSFAIAGLLDNRVTDVLDKVPGLGDVPVLGKLFQSRSRSKTNNELLVLVTPHIVQPLVPDNVPAGPAFPEPFLPTATAPATSKTPEKN